MKSKGSSPISLLKLGKYERINELVLPLKSSENRRISADFRGNREVH